MTERILACMEAGGSEIDKERKTEWMRNFFLSLIHILTSFFGSIQTTLTRVMDPNEYDSLMNTLVASFSNINSEIIVFSLILLAAVIFALRKELALLDVLTLGKEQAINLGVDYDRCIRRLLLGVALCIAVALSLIHILSGNGSAELRITAFRHIPMERGFDRLVVYGLVKGLDHRVAKGQGLSLIHI